MRKLPFSLLGVLALLAALLLGGCRKNDPSTAVVTPSYATMPLERIYILPINMSGMSFRLTAYQQQRVYQQIADVLSKTHPHTMISMPDETVDLLRRTNQLSSCNGFSNLPSDELPAAGDISIVMSALNTDGLFLELLRTTPGDGGGVAARLTLLLYGKSGVTVKLLWMNECIERVDPSVMSGVVQGSALYQNSLKYLLKDMPVVKITEIAGDHQ